MLNTFLQVVKKCKKNFKTEKCNVFRYKDYMYHFLW